MDVGRNMWGNWEENQKIAFRIVLIYIFISILWILFSDYILEKYFHYGPEWLDTAKGWMFILFTALVFYNLIQKGIKGAVDNETKYRLIVENVTDLIVVMDRNGNLEYASPSHQTIVGFSPEEYEGKTIFDFINNAEISKMQERLHNKTIQKNEDLVEMQIKHKDGHSVLVEGKGVPIIGDNGEVEHYVVFAHDITEQKLAEKHLKESEERYRKLVEYSPETTLIHIDGKIVYVNQAGIELAGADHLNQIIGRNVLDFVSLEGLEYVQNRMRIVQEAGKSEIGEQQIVRLDGTRLFVEMLAFQTTYQGEKAVQVIVRDITERKKAEEQVRSLAFYDSLTNLPNRNSLYLTLGEALVRTQVMNKILAVMFLDLDRFKMINDTFGHGFGDLLLQQVSTRLNECMLGNGKLYRNGGDEYIIVVEPKETKEISQLAEQLIDILSSPFFIQGRRTFISTSIGISMYPRDGETVEALIQNADTAMYEAKENARNNYQFYTSTLHVMNRRKMELENGIRNAIEKDEFTLYYQPQVHLITNKIIGLEALIRWKHPEYGFISPAEFIPVAEETGLIVSIGNWVLKTACQQNKRWEEKGFPLVRIAVNVSALQFRDKCFVKTVEEVLQNTKLESRYLELEITESVTHNVEEATTIMNDLKKLGVHLSMDDFGTGYTSLNYLRHFPIDKLKIDKSFVDEINKHLNGEVIVRTIIELGNSLGFKVIAEGVENEQQISFLIENNCHLGQGYFFSTPLLSEEIEKMLKEK